VTPRAVIAPARLAGSGLLRTQTDERLVNLVRAGNDQAFEAIVLRYRRSLLRHCRRLLPAARAEDAVQQALLRALEAIRADRRELRLGPWLHRIAHNTAIDALRRGEAHAEELDERLDGVEPPDSVVERRARFDSVVATLHSLPERQRRALVLREMEGRSYEEIAGSLGVSGAGVRQLLNRARNAMRAAASAVLPPALLGRMAGSQTGARVAEVVDPQGASALLGKCAAAALATGAAALVAMTGVPPGERLAKRVAEARTEPPAAEASSHAGRLSAVREPPATAAESRGSGTSRGDGERPFFGGRRGLSGRRLDPRPAPQAPGAPDALQRGRRADGPAAGAPGSPNATERGAGGDGQGAGRPSEPGDDDGGSAGGDRDDELGGSVEHDGQADGDDHGGDAAGDGGAAPEEDDIINADGPVASSSADAQDGHRDADDAAAARLLAGSAAAGHDSDADAGDDELD
jgi:RNA polymerase sigma factor (sigma-70 family)